MKVSAPCQGCPDRVVGCHSACARYAEYRAALERQREKIRYEWIAIDAAKERWLRAKATYYRFRGDK